MFRLFIILLLFLLPFTTADIRNIKFTTSNVEAVQFQDFGFTKSGHISISIKSVTFGSIHVNPSRLAFCLLPDNGMDFNSGKRCKADDGSPRCFIDDKDNHVQTLFNFTHLVPPQNSFSQSYPITHPGEYSLYFANCQPNSSVTMSVTTEMYNLINGDYKSYLSRGETPLPYIYLMFAVTYFVFIKVWWGICVANRETYFEIHLLMVGPLLMKALSLVWAAVDVECVKFRGKSWGWNAVFYALHLVKDIMLCIVIRRIGTHWQILKPPLVQVLMMIPLMIFILAQPIVGLAHNAMIQTRPLHYIWLQTEDFPDLIFMCLPLITTAIFLMSNAMHSEADQEVFKFTKLSVLVSLEWFLVLVLVPICKTEIIFGLRLLWLGKTADEIVALCGYLFFFYQFRYAVRKNLFIAVNDGGTSHCLIKKSY